MSETPILNETSQSLESADQQAIRALFERYFYFYDRGLEAGLLQCFTEDAEGQFDVGGPPVVIKGRASIAKSMVGAVAIRHGSNHMPSNARIEIQGDRAKSDMYAISHIIFGDATAGRALVRGLHYLDELVRTPEGWKLSKRIHKALWQYEAPTTRPEVKKT